MVKARVIETNEGIQDAITAEQFDAFARVMRDRGWNGVDGMIAAGISKGAMCWKSALDLAMSAWSWPKS